MPKLKKYVVITLILACLSLIAMLFSHLALTDIAHGEANVDFEWTVLRIATVILTAFIISTVFTLGQVLKMKL
jgi:hypothetical protein